MVVVLHVTDSMSSGTYEAVLSIANSHKRQIHHLLYDYKSDAAEPNIESLSSTFKSVARWSSGVFRRSIHLNRILKELNPDFIYLHSSWAGFYGRLVPTKAVILYTSHGFGFQRNDVSRIARNIFLLIEKLLSKRTDVYVAIWPIELKYANTKLNFRKTKAYILDEVKFILFEKGIQNAKTTSNSNFAVVGRVSAAKDPRFTNEIGKITDTYFKINWFGAVATNQELFRKFGQLNYLNFQSWIPKKQLIEILSDHVALLVTSSWEVGPLVFYEALQAGIPVIPRNIPAIQALGIRNFETPEEFGQEMQRLVSDKTYRSRLLLEQFECAKSAFIGFDSKSLFDE